MRSERRSKVRTYDGKIAADLPERPLRLTSTGLVTLAAAISKLATSIRLIADNYDAVSDAERAYANAKITRGIGYISEIWTTLNKKGK